MFVEGRMVNKLSITPRYLKTLEKMMGVSFKDTAKSSAFSDNISSPSPTSVVSQTRNQAWITGRSCMQEGK